MRRVFACMALTTVVVVAGSCGGISTPKPIAPGQRPVALDSTLEDLLAKYNATATGVRSLNATVELKPTAGSKYSGLIEEYHEVKAFLLAQRPANIRMIGQAPVIGKTIFDMTSDAEDFRVSIPSKNKFLIGTIAAERASNKPIENLRPQHLLDALLWPEIQKQESVLFEEFNDENAKYYVLTVLRGGYQTEILRKVWFDRADLRVARLQSFGPKGYLLSDTRFADWEPVDASANSNSNGNAPSAFPRVIRILRPHDDYLLDLQILKVALNENIPAERFQLEQPAGSELVHVGEHDGAPSKDGKP